METEEVIFVEESPFVIIFPCSSCTHAARTGVVSPSHFLMIMWLKSQSASWCMPSTFSVLGKRVSAPNR